MSLFATSLADAFMPLIAYLRQFQQAPANDTPQLAANVDRLIADARRTAHDLGFTEADIDSALFAVVAWADEALLAAPWGGAAEWPRHLLQKRYFNITNAGVDFFTRLEALTPQQLPVREVYTLCLSLGFAGRYGYERNLKAREEIQRASMKLLLQDGEGLPAAVDEHLFPDGYGLNLPPPRPEPASRLRWRFTSLSFQAFIAPLVGLALLYLLYHVTIWQMVDTLLPQIK
ncbi:type VI secretion system protein ImpK [Oryzomicrobium terrae]|uniref:Type VI secretion system protein ImpK n=1 Tax=Oryzomicrobium terrae TaxID=1735038 RepID=A0A5C1EBS0_9RHOO|nr:DotU family type IV/VI secretion system protein [Oryzomicrobium terrae]QEL66332.1 type VI secretion system protein ImpK [Oryzomicrobium terrae]